ncbi:MAG: YopX family protein [Clostridium sp.]|nr:YopX family protein [Clostridium sp.]
MEREILFRGKLKDNGEWFYGDLLKYADTAQIWYKEEGYGKVNVIVNPETVGQYTGLTDRNGTRIFEGDIVNILCENEEIGVIKWDEDTARFIVSADGFCADFDNYYGMEFEVIGNIHDNPEMIENERID